MVPMLTKQIVSGQCDILMSKTDTRVDERRAKSDDFVLVVEGDVRYRICYRDAVLHMLSQYSLLLHWIIYYLRLVASRKHALRPRRQSQI